MELKITAKNIKLTEAIKNYAESRVNRLDKFFTEDAWAQLVLSVDKKINQKAEITIHGAKKKIASKAIKQDLYKAIDEAVAKIETQLFHYSLNFGHIVQNQQKIFLPLRLL